MTAEVQTAVGALLAGFVTSVHCVGMCGPMACGLASLRSDDSGRARAAVGYHTGRLASYATVGLIAGLTGSGPIDHFAGTPVALLPWFLVLVFVVTALGLHLSLPRPGWFIRATSKVRSSLIRLSSGKGGFLVGLGTPLLPCGPLYAMFGIALLSGSGAKGMEFMLAFGMGTIPLMWIAQWQYHRFGNRLSPVAVKRIQRAVALTAAVMMTWRLWGTLPFTAADPNCPFCQ